MSSVDLISAKGAIWVKTHEVLRPSLFLGPLVPMGTVPLGWGDGHAMELLRGVNRMKDMSRAARSTYEPGSMLHIISRGVEQRTTFPGDDDRMVFLKMMHDSFRERGVSLLAYCLMGNHFHLLVAVSEIRIGVPMHLLLTRYAQYFNRKYARVGHLFQDRFMAKICGNSAYLFNLVAYIHLNPVRAQMVEKPEDWIWSSHHELVGTGEGYLDYSRFADVTGFTRDEIRERYLERVRPNGSPTAMTELLQRAAYVAGVDVAGVVSGRRGGDYTRAKRILKRWALEEGYSLSELARTLNCAIASVAQL